ncbi:MAG TPA: HlyD family efflux transporter periplasmic adaptor subunit [Streptosporangiaceae bacterium]|nr:HlyD family efflux transporter periplasmic adaptor subunit [Streptosporangiaceae bacterium]
MVLRRFFPLVLVVGLPIAAVVSACSGDEPARVRIGSVARADVAEVIEAPGAVSARATATLRSPAEGTIRELRVADGEEVRKGEVLAKISSPSAREQLDQARDADRQAAAGGGAPPGVDLSTFRRQSDRTARRGFATARAAAGQIPDPAVRAQVLGQIAKAQAEYMAAAATARAAVAQLNSGIGSVTSAMSSITAAQRVQTRAAVRAAERTVKALVLRAPFSGVADLGGPAAGGLSGQLPPQLQGQLGQGGGQGGQASLAAGLSGVGGGAKDASAVAAGAPVATGDAVVTVIDVSRLTVSADVDETDVLQVRRGVAARVELDAAPGASYAATVTGVGATPAQSSGGGVTYKVTLTLGDGTYAGGGTAPRPKPGMSAVVDLRVREARGALSVPSSAIVTSGQNATVWVVAGGQAQRRVVRLGAQGDTLAQVLSGVGEGERIVVRGADSVRQGQRLSGQ